MTLIWAFLHKRHKRRMHMSNIDLSKYGIKNAKEIVYNPSYELLFKEEKQGLCSIKENSI